MRSRWDTSQASEQQDGVDGDHLSHIATTLFVGAHEAAVRFVASRESNCVRNAMSAGTIQPEGKKCAGRVRGCSGRAIQLP